MHQSAGQLLSCVHFRLKNIDGAAVALSRYQGSVEEQMTWLSNMQAKVNAQPDVPDSSAAAQLLIEPTQVT